MATLPRELRRELERTAKDARRVGEAGAQGDRSAGDRRRQAACGALPAGQSLRERLRAHGRQLGDRREPRSGKQLITSLVASAPTNTGIACSSPASWPKTTC